MPIRPIQFLTLVLAIATWGAVAQAQIRMVEVDPTTENVTLRNFGTTSVDVATWWLCRAPGTYRQISALPLSGPTLLGPGDTVTVTYTGQLNPAGQGVGLYETPSFGLASAMRDYMQFLTDAGFREPIAVAANLWPLDDQVDGAGPYVYTGNGGDIGAAFWQGASVAALPSMGPAAALALVAGLVMTGRRFLHRI